MLRHEAHVRLRRRINSTVQVRVGESHNSVIKSNCVTVRWGGEQLEMNDQSVGDELDSAGCCGEPACVGRSLKTITYVDVAIGKKRYVGASSGWRWNGRKFMRSKQGDLLWVVGELPGFSVLEKTNKPIGTQQESEPS